MPRRLWIAAGLCVVLGYAGVVVRYETAIAGALGRSQQLYERSGSAERAIRNAVRLHAAAVAVHRDLRAVGSGGLANLLALLEVSGARFHLRVVRVIPQAPSAARTILTEQPIEIGVEGSFRGILQFLDQLTRQDVLLSVDDEKLSLKRRPDASDRSPKLEATIHVRLYAVENKQLLKEGLDESN
ncbi:MAG: hypothetical protein M3Y21_05795 [Candidatus Eremiobacteraeota bacterium]|nr:hypothetical protein [Candidatus Eremiobacteraeota bacterium]